MQEFAYFVTEVGKNGKDEECKSIEEKNSTYINTAKTFELVFCILYTNRC